MSKNNKFAETTDNATEDQAYDENTDTINDAAEPQSKPQSEAGAKISAAQKGVPKQRIIVLTQKEGEEPVEHVSLCAAIVAHGLSKEVDWYTGRNALKSADSWQTKGKVWTESSEEGGEPVVASEYDVTFKLVSASWKTDAANAEAENTGTDAAETAEAA